MLDQSANIDLKKFGLITLSLVLVAIFWSWITSPVIVTVTGSGQVVVPATNATISFTLSANDNSIQSAVSSVNATADNITTYLIGKGVLESDIARSQVTAVPASLVTQGGNGFQATVSMAFKTVNVTDVSNLVAELYGNGAYVVSQPVLSVENQEKLDSDVFATALADAKSQARVVGNKNWKFIRKIVGISQATSPSTSTATTKADSLTTNVDDIASINGVFKVAKNVTVTYKMW